MTRIFSCTGGNAARMSGPCPCEDQLPREYDLEPGKSREGLLVYEVPQEETEFTLAFLELIENGTEEGEEGDLFLTRFTVE